MVKKVIKHNKRISSEELNKKLDTLLAMQKKEFKEEKRIEKEEGVVEGLENKEIDEMKKLEKLEEEIKREVEPHPLRKVTYKDIGKAIIGAFVGIVSHFTLLEGAHFAENITMTKATSLLVISFFLGMLMLYYTGFRKVRDVRFLTILPLRLVIIYFTMLIVIMFSLMIFGVAGEIGSDLLYKEVAVISLPAIIGASAADLIGD